MKKRFALVGVAIGAVTALLAGTAMAFMLVTGVGTAVSTPYKVADLKVSFTAPTLVPGDRGQQVVVTVTNPNNRAVQVNNIEIPHIHDKGCRISASVVQPNVTLGAGQTKTLTEVIGLSQDARDRQSCDYELDVIVRGDLLGNG